MSLLRVRATISGWSGGPGLFTAYFDAGVTPGLPEFTEAVARVRACFASAASVIHPSVTIDPQETVAIIDETTGTLTGLGTGAAVTNVTGSATGDMYAPGVQALLVDVSTAILNGRLLQGRHFMGPLAEGAVGSNGELAATSVTALSNAGAALRTTIVTAITHSVWHRPNPPGSNNGSKAPVGASRIPTKLAILTSRRD